MSRDIRSGLWAQGFGSLSPKLKAHGVLFAALVLIPACEPVGKVLTDFKQQPKVDPWETPADTIAPRANPQGSVSIYGSVAPGFAYGRSQTVATVDSMSRLANPVAVDERSIRNGGQLYQINCAVCHGVAGAGDGPVTKFGYPPMPLVGPNAKAQTQYSDGYIFGMIRNGRGLMPPYNRIEEAERWDVINYLRAIQANPGNAPAVPIGRPGETGSLVPGPSLTAPTRPAPHYRPPVATPPAPPAGAATNPPRNP
jgi:mono/diheme cytochrome c family protein